MTAESRVSTPSELQLRLMLVELGPRIEDPDVRDQFAHIISSTIAFAKPGGYMRADMAEKLNSVLIERLSGISTDELHNLIGELTELELQNLERQRTSLVNGKPREENHTDKLKYETNNTEVKKGEMLLAKPDLSEEERSYIERAVFVYMGLRDETITAVKAKQKAELDERVAFLEEVRVKLAARAEKVKEVKEEHVLV